MVLAGNLNYSFNKYLTVGAGIFSLPGTRSVEGNFPFWLSVDSRLIADEFFRPSYSSGIKASGTIAKGLTYQAMIANNRSTLGVSAAQLPNRFNTVSSALVWMPMGDYGLGWGDFEHHESPVTRFGFHFNHSDENKQSQPNSDQFENVQLRLSDGSVILASAKACLNLAPAMLWSVTMRLAKSFTAFEVLRLSASWLLSISN